MYKFSSNLKSLHFFMGIFQTANWYDSDRQCPSSEILMMKIWCATFYFYVFVCLFAKNILDAFLSAKKDLAVWHSLGITCVIIFKMKK